MIGVLITDILWSKNTPICSSAVSGKPRLDEEQICESAAKRANKLDNTKMNQARRNKIPLKRVTIGWWSKD